MNGTLKIFSSFFMLYFLSCSLQKKDTATCSFTEMKSNSIIPTQAIDPIDQSDITNKVYFIASGTEPFWSISISMEQIKFKTPTDSIVMPHVKPIQAMDSNVKFYKTKTDTSEMSIQITQSQCRNEMSGNLSPYTVAIQYKKNTEPLPHKIVGCGVYLTDYRLHDIWVLEKLNGKNIEIKNFNNNLPLIEINTTSNTFIGFAGCNRMNGILFYEKELLRFTAIEATKMMCFSNNQETVFLGTLQSVNKYKIENNRLWLSNPSKELLVFKKID